MMNRTAIGSISPNSKVTTSNGIIPEQNNLNASDHIEAGGNYPADKCIARRQLLQRTVNEFTNRNHLTLSGSGFTLNALETMQSDETKGSNNYVAKKGHAKALNQLKSLDGYHSLVEGDGMEDGIAKSKMRKIAGVVEGQEQSCCN